MASNLISFALLANLVAAAPMMHVQENAVSWGTGGSIVGFICLILDIIAIVEVVQSTRPVLPKLLWSLLIFIFPLGGVLIYFLFSNREAHKRGYEAIP